MIAVDTSALMAIALCEPSADACRSMLETAGTLAMLDRIHGARAAGPP